MKKKIKKKLRKLFITISDRKVLISAVFKLIDSNKKVKCNKKNHLKSWINKKINMSK